MAKSIKALLKKNSWTGTEVGKLFIQSLIYNYQEQMAGHGTQNTLVSSAQFSKMLGSLQGEEIVKYNLYSGLNNWLISNHASATGMYLQADEGLKMLMSILTTAAAAENTYRYIEQMPLIVTETQYERAAEANRQEIFRTWNDVGVFYLMEDAIMFYMKQLWRDPNAKNPMQEVKKKYMSSPITSEHIAKQYAFTSNAGYYQLADGTRSDQVSKKEWFMASIQPCFRGKIEKALNGEDTELDDKMKLIISLVFDNIPKEGMAASKKDKGLLEIQTEAAKDVLGETYFVPMAWYAYPQMPADMTKWDVVSWPSDIGDYYYALSHPLVYNPKVYKEQAEDFYNEFSDLADLLLEDMTKRLGKDVTKIPPSKWHDPVWTVKELYDNDVYGYKQKIDSGKNIFKDNRQASFNGIAVIKDPGIRNYGSGDFVPPNPDNLFLGNLVGLEQFTSSNPNAEERIQELKDYRARIEYGYRFVLAFDKACELVAEYTRLKDFVIFKKHAEKLEEKINALNAFVPVLYLNIKTIQHQDRKSQAEKLEVLTKYFSPIDIKALQLKRKDVTAGRKMIADNMRAFRTQNGLLMNALLGV